MAYRSENYAGPKGRRKRPPVVGESAADKVPVVTNPGGDRLRAALAARNRSVAARPAPNVSTETGLMLNPALALAGILAFGNPNIKAGFRDTKALAARAKDTLIDPDASRRQKMEAAGNAAVITGGLNFLPGRKPKSAPTPKPEGAEKIIEALPEARRVRAEQQAGYKAERGKRGGAAASAYERAGGGQAGQKAAKAELKGELPKLPFTRLMKEFGSADSEMRAVLQPHVDGMLDFITQHPSMRGRPLAAVGAREALQKALDGITPQKAEIRKLEVIFGEEATKYFKVSAAENVTKTLGLSRAMEATADLSRALRQDLPVLARHPVMWSKNWRVMIAAGKDPVKAREMMDDLMARPNWDEYREVGLKVTGRHGPMGSMDEDLIGADLAERIPVAGKIVAAASNAYNVGGAYLRANLYDLISKQNPDMTLRHKRDLARAINAATGMGRLWGKAEQAAPFLTIPIWSPRLIASRVAFLNPQWYFSLKGPARREAIEMFTSMVAAGTAVLWLAKRLGADVEMDPRSSDFGKIRVGNTRVAIFGGFESYVVNGYRYVNGETKTPGPNGEVRSKSREDIALNFGMGKLSPNAGYVRDFQRGRTFDYEPFDPLKSAGKLVTPIGFQTAYEGYQQGGPQLGATSFLLNAVGLGVGTYADDDKPKRSSSRPQGGRYRGGPGGGGRYKGGPGRNYAGPRS